MNSRFLPYLLGFSALCLSGVSAYFSIFGLSKLFAGAGASILVMAGVMEVSKVVLTVYLHRFWGRLYMFFKLYLMFSVIALVGITTMGAYGFLSAGFQASITKLETFQTSERFLQDKIDFFNDEVDLYNRDLDRVSETISTLSGVQSTSIQVRDTTVVGGVRNTISTVDTRLAQQRLDIERETRQEIVNKRQAVVDSLQTYRQLLLQAQNTNDLTSELGPLQYLADLSQRPITEVVNILIIFLILVLDPLAISMILASSIGLDSKIKSLESNTPIKINVEDEQKQDRENNRKVDKKVQEPLPNISKQPDKTPVQDTEYSAKKPSSPQKGALEKYNDTLQKKTEITPVKILQKSPSYVHLLMSDGSRRKVLKKDLDISEDENKIKYL